MSWMHLIFFLLSITLTLRADFKTHRDRILTLLSKNEPTVIVEARLHPDSEDLINQDMILDPLALFNVYQYGIFYALYSRPIDVTNVGTYSSQILSDFHYDESNLTLTLQIREGIKFSDGQALTAEEVAFTIARVALKRPLISPYDRIQGANTWRKISHPLTTLPTGIKVRKNPDKVEIIFARKTRDPYYWLTFPMMSIFPRSCVDTKTSSVVCKHPPFSGLYQISEVNKNMLSMQRRIRNEAFPFNLHFVFLVEDQIPDFLSSLDTNHVVELQDGFNFVGGVETQIKNQFRITGFTENWANIAILDYKSETFQSDRTRLFFAEKMRTVLQRMRKNVSGSVIPILSPGYLSIESLRSQIIPFEEVERKKIISHLKKHPPNLGDFFKINTDKFYSVLVKTTTEELGVPLRNEGTSNIRFRKISFENVDPVHAVKFVLSYGSPYKESMSETLYTSLADLDSNNLKQNKIINSNLYKDASISVLMSYGRMQVLRKDSPLQFKEQFLRQDWQRFFERKIN